MDAHFLRIERVCERDLGMFADKVRECFLLMRTWDGFGGNAAQCGHEGWVDVANGSVELSACVWEFD